MLITELKDVFENADEVSAIVKEEASTSLLKVTLEEQTQCLGAAENLKVAMGEKFQHLAKKIEELEVSLKGI